MIVVYLSLCKAGWRTHTWETIGGRYQKVEATGVTRADALHALANKVAEIENAVKEAANETSL